MPEPHEQSTHVVDEIAPALTNESQGLDDRAAGLHNVLHLLLAVSGVVMLGAAFLDWLIHPVTLWGAVP
jgi:hypothetical protein